MSQISVQNEEARPGKASRDRQIIESITEFAIIVTDRKGFVTDWNTGAERILGWSLFEMIGLTAEAFFTPEDREIDQLHREMSDALTLGRAIDERWHLKKDETRFWASGEMMPLRDDAGEHVGFVKLLRDRTEQHLAGVRLRETEVRRNALLELSEALASSDIPDAMSLGAARIVGAALDAGRVGYGTVAADGETFTVPSDWTAEGYPSLAGTYRMDDDVGYAEDLRCGRTVVIPDIHLDDRTASNTGPLEDVAVRSLINCPISENGRTVAVLYVNDDRVREWSEEDVAFVRDATSRTRDAIERRRAEGNLRESEERQRVAIASGEVGIFDFNLETGVLIWDERVRIAFGVLSDRVMTQEEKLAAIHPADRVAFDAAFEATLRNQPFNLLFRTIGIDDAHLRWVNVQGRVMEAKGARNFIGAVRDVTQRIALEQRQTVLNQELAHRLKNTLAVVQSIATQTLRNSPDLPTARDSLTKRIQALSKAHDVLLTGQADAGSVEAIIRSAVAIHDPDGRIALRGAELIIGPKAALTLALIMHELSTNAVKYGALSVLEGRVHVAWVVEINAETRLPTLALSWQEIDGPPAVPPTRKGFGTRLIEMGLSGSSGGSVALDYAADGLKCRIVAPLTELQATDDA